MADRVAHVVCAVEPAAVVDQRAGERSADRQHEHHQHRTGRGDDVVQLCVHENCTSILQPVKKLEAFQRVTLAPGQSKTVTFTLLK